ncbi:hypothetical protein MACH18_29460 [Phaeobacter italicus]|nr:hypothetical protein MACH18_29460 [Phaeobacter italicus]
MIDLSNDIATAGPDGFWQAQRASTDGNGLCDQNREKNDPQDTVHFNQLSAD